VALDQEDMGAHCNGQEGQCEHGGTGNVAFRGDNDGIVSAFVGVVGDLCVGMDDNTLE